MSTLSSLTLDGDLTRTGHAVRTFLQALGTPPRLLGLGEPVHNVETFRHWRNQIFQVLVQEHGFRSIALESDVLAGQRVNKYVLGGDDHLDDVLAQGLSHGFGALATNRELVEWLRDFNRGREDGEQVRFYGFDGPLENLWAASPEQSLLALQSFLAAHLESVPADPTQITQLCGPQERWTDPAGALDASKSIGNSSAARQLRLIADDLTTLLQVETPRLRGERGFWEAQLYARTANDLLRYHAILADPAPNRIARMLGLRDRMMADNLQAIAEREVGRGPTLVFAHNLHLQRPISRMGMRGQTLEWWSAGAHLRARPDMDFRFVMGLLGNGKETHPDTLTGQLESVATSATLLGSGALRAALPAGTLAASEVTAVDGILFVKGDAPT